MVTIYNYASSNDDLARMVNADEHEHKTIELIHSVEEFTEKYTKHDFEHVYLEFWDNIVFCNADDTYRTVLYGKIDTIKIIEREERTTYIVTVHGKDITYIITCK